LLALGRNQIGEYTIPPVRLVKAMDAVKSLISVSLVVAALLSGVFWITAAYAKVVAKPGGNEGVGFGGSPVNVRDHSGAVVDFLQTYTLQSKWNSRAALASAAAAILAAVLFLLQRISP
jgi:hypothetical protein